MKREIVRIVYVTPDGELCKGRLLERAASMGATKLLYVRAASLNIVDARYSEARLPGTWHHESKPD